MTLSTERTKNKELASRYFNTGIRKSNLKDYKGEIANFDRATEICPDYAIPYYIEHL